jgi:hypothetical protein
MPNKKGSQLNKKVPDLNTKVAKYYFAKKTGMSQGKATVVAGYADPGMSTRIEQSKSYKALQKYYRDELQDQISIKQIAGEHRKVIMQDEQLGPKIAAIKIAMDSIEPTPPAIENDDDRVYVVLK